MYFIATAKNSKAVHVPCNESTDPDYELFRLVIAQKKRMELGALGEEISPQSMKSLSDCQQTSHSRFTWINVGIGINQQLSHDVLGRRGTGRNNSQLRAAAANEELGQQQLNYN